MIYLKSFCFSAIFSFISVDSIYFIIVVAVASAIFGISGGIIFHKRKTNNRQMLEQNPLYVPSGKLEAFESSNEDGYKSFDPEVQLGKRQRLKAKFNYLHARLNGKPDMIKPNTDIKDQVKVLPYNKSRELPRTSLQLGDELGSGMFGKVFKGTLSGIDVGDDKLTVAIKTQSGYNDEDGIGDFLDEIKIMSNVYPHLNLVSMVGACTSGLRDEGLLWLVLEFCPHGDLKKFLERNEKHILDGKELIDPINSRCLIKWAFDIANGMQYLANNKIMHGDLAARNVLLGDAPASSGACLVAKVSDFGLSKKFYDNLKYKKSSRMLVPWRWMAIEYLTRDFFTLTSDVWSFGVLFYEILSFGESPYGQQGYEEVIDKLQKGYRLTCPKKIKGMKTSWVPKKVYEKVSQVCFKEDPIERASFSDVIEILKKVLRQEEIDHYDKMKNLYTSSSSLHNSTQSLC